MKSFEKTLGCFPKAAHSVEPASMSAAISRSTLAIVTWSDWSAMLWIDSSTGRPAPSIAPIWRQKIARSFVLTFLPFLVRVGVMGAGETATTISSSFRRAETSDISLSANLVPWTVLPFGVLAVKMNSGMFKSLWPVVTSVR